MDCDDDLKFLTGSCPNVMLAIHFHYRKRVSITILHNDFVATVTHCGKCSDSCRNMGLLRVKKKSGFVGPTTLSRDEAAVSSSVHFSCKANLRGKYHC